MISLRDLEYALALGVTGQFGKAAKRCRVSQPTLSTQIAKLETELGSRLFERAGREVRPTAAGARVLTQARRVLDAVEVLRLEARGDQDQWSGPLRLGVIPTAGPYLMPHLLPVIADHHPRAELLIREAQTDELIERLLASDLDAAIVSPPLSRPGLVHDPIAEEPFVLAAPVEHRLARLERVGLEDIAAEPMLLLEEGHCLRDQMLELCVAGRPRSERFQASSVESLRQMVAAGIGVTLLPELATRGPLAQLPGITLRRLTPAPPTRSLVLAWRQSFPLHRLLHELAQTMRQEVHEVIHPRPASQAASAAEASSGSRSSRP